MPNLLKPKRAGGAVVKPSAVASPPGGTNGKSDAAKKKVVKATSSSVKRKKPSTSPAPEKKAVADKSSKKKEETKKAKKATGKKDAPSSGKRKTKPHPDAPKGAKSAWLIFSLENRSTVKDENPSASFGELGKLLSQKWKSLSAEEKQVWVTKAAADKERYQLQKQEFERDHPGESMMIQVDDDVGKKRKDKNSKGDSKRSAPRAKSAYVFYMSAQRAQVKQDNPELGNKEIFAAVAAKWKTATEEEKKPFVEMAAEDKKRVKSESEANACSDTEDDAELKKKVASKRKQPSSSVGDAKPKKQQKKPAKSSPKKKQTKQSATDDDDMESFVVDDDEEEELVDDDSSSGSDDDDDEAAREFEAQADQDDDDEEEEVEEDDEFEQAL